MSQGVKAVYNWLLQDSGVTAIVGSGSSARIYPQEVPQGKTRPCITLQSISDPRLHVLSGPAGIAGTLVQVDIWADTYLAAQSLKDAIKGTPSGRKLDGYRASIADIQVQACLCEDIRDGYETPQDGGDEGIHRVSMDFRLWTVEV